jgi:hypothetical protein
VKVGILMMLRTIQNTTEAPRIVAKTARDNGAIAIPRFAKTEMNSTSVHVDSTSHFVGPGPRDDAGP